MASLSAPVSISLSPTSPIQSILSAGLERLSAGDYAEARRLLEQATELAPDSIDAHILLARVCLAASSPAAAAQAARRAVALGDNAAAVFILGAALVALGEEREALPLLEQAAEQSPRDAVVLRELGAALAHLGQFDRARQILMQALEIDPTIEGPMYTLVKLQPLNDGSAEAEAVFALLNRVFENADNRSPSGRRRLLRAMGKANEDRGDFDKAFACYAEANAQQSQEAKPDIAGVEAGLAAIRHRFDKGLLERLSGAGHRSKRPIFIVGMPRSGSTLVEQIISAHPEVHGAGEIPNLCNLIASTRGQGNSVYPAWADTMNAVDCRAIGQAYLSSLPEGGDASRVSDKWLDNFIHLGLIHLCLPDATIIHCQRDPRDACFSAFATGFTQGQPFAHDLGLLGRYWRAYQGHMQHWRDVLPPGRFLNVPYEALTADLEGWARRIVAHCGLPWDHACLQFWRSDRVVRTASFVQVRRPIYSDSVGRWRRFARHLLPLLDALDGEASQMFGRGR